MAFTRHWIKDGDVQRRPVRQRCTGGRDEQTEPINAILLKRKFHLLSVIRLGQADNLEFSARQAGNGDHRVACRCRLVDELERVAIPDITIGQLDERRRAVLEHIDFECGLVGEAHEY